MECKKCGKNLADKEYKKVAEWSFCLGCFQALMDKAEEKKVEAVPETPVSAPKLEEDKQKCQVCSKDLENGEGHDMLGILFCPDCYDVLVKSPAIPARPEMEEEEEAKQKVAQVRVDVRMPTECHGCGRQIPAMGSKDFEGKPYCPDCYHALPEFQTRKPRPFPAADKKTAGPTEPQAWLRCQACNREVLPENLKTVQGFEICQACLKTDPDAALEIAQARHREAIERMKKELDS